MSTLLISIPVALVAFGIGWWWRHKKALHALVVQQRESAALRTEMHHTQAAANGDDDDDDDDTTTMLDAVDAVDAVDALDALDDEKTDPPRGVSTPPAVPLDASTTTATPLTKPALAAPAPDSGTSPDPLVGVPKTPVPTAAPVSDAGMAERSALRAALNRERQAKLKAEREAQALRSDLAAAKARHVVDAKSLDTVQKSLRQTVAKLEDKKRELFEERRAHGEAHSVLDERQAALDEMGEKLTAAQTDVGEDTVGQGALEDVQLDLEAAREALTQAKTDVNEARLEVDRLQRAQAETEAEMEAAKEGYAAYEQELAAALQQPAKTAERPPDDLTRIKGVGKKLAETLRENGVTSFAEIAAWGEADVDRVADSIGRFGSRVRRDDWKAQAQRFLDEG